MNRILFLSFLSIPIFSFGQIENKWQPDSIYINRQVKRIFVYMNSPKDLSEIIEFDRTGRRIRTTKYRASHNRRTRKHKTIDKINFFEYDEQNLLTRIVDSIGQDSITYNYNPNGKLISSRKNLGSFVYETSYNYQPFESTTTRKNDSIIIYHKTKEYDKDFYVKRFYGFYFQPKLKKVTDTINGIPNTTAYKDYTDLEKFEDDKTIKNIFNENGQLIKSNIYSKFMNDRLNEYQLTYKYYDNGLLKSIGGYVPRYFEYEFWK
ncbi:hypothetical protein [Flagellimonas lutaonensis]|uniref:YD repeat-containing protein n=1 Tax=Flagellimonas lutaonensis TaxID=516051 RepID=A0A0D5YNQ6_9FLAO|nr:hypothetical protein [Allomuricauda lutaonensis]AKA33960.1 hypothetical protein VC82_274 [Allomuricauda lutaonensis]